MSLSNSFYDYARQGEKSRQRLGYKGVQVITYQEGQPGDVGYVASDTTVGVIDPVVIYPDFRTGLDMPGRSGGPALDNGNSLSIPGTQLPDGIAVPMEATVTAPDHTLTVASETILEFTNIRPTDEGETATVDVELFLPSTLVTGAGQPADTDVVVEYWDGATYQTATMTRRWDLVDTTSYEITLPAATAGSTKIRMTFGATAETGDYRAQFTLSVGGVKRVTAYDDFELA